MPVYAKETVDLTADSKAEIDMTMDAPTATYTLSYSSQEGSNINAKKAADYINGYILLSGEEFSFNDVVGERTTERGFVPGNQVSGTAITKGIGGGICKISTMLHELCLTTGMQITEHHNHTIGVTYAAPGRDAAVAWGILDYRFINTSKDPIQIYCTYDDINRQFHVSFTNL